MVRAIGDEGDDSSVVEHRHHQRYVREVGATEEGVVEHQRVTGRPVPLAHDRTHRECHAAEVDGDVRGLRGQAPVRAEQGTGEVEPFADVR